MDEFHAIPGISPVVASLLKESTLAEDSFKEAVTLDTTGEIKQPQNLESLPEGAVITSLTVREIQTDSPEYKQGELDWNGRTHIALFNNEDKSITPINEASKINTDRSGMSKTLFLGSQAMTGQINKKMGDKLGRGVIAIPGVFSQGTNNNNQYASLAGPSFEYYKHVCLLNELHTQSIFQQHSMEFAILNVHYPDKSGSITFYTLFGDARGKTLGVMRREVNIDIDAEDNYTYTQNTKLVGTDYLYRHMAASMDLGNKQKDRAEVEEIVAELKKVSFKGIQGMPAKMINLKENITKMLNRRTRSQATLFSRNAKVPSAKPPLAIAMAIERIRNGHTYTLPDLKSMLNEFIKQGDEIYPRGEPILKLFLEACCDNVLDMLGQDLIKENDTKIVLINFIDSIIIGINSLDSPFEASNLSVSAECAEKILPIIDTMRINPTSIGLLMEALNSAAKIGQSGQGVAAEASAAGGSDADIESISTESNRSQTPESIGIMSAGVTEGGFVLVDEIPGHYNDLLMKVTALSTLDIDVSEDYSLDLVKQKSLALKDSYLLYFPGEEHENSDDIITETILTCIRKLPEDNQSIGTLVEIIAKIESRDPSESQLTEANGLTLDIAEKILKELEKVPAKKSWRGKYTNPNQGIIEKLNEYKGRQNDSTMPSHTTI